MKRYLILLIILALTLSGCTTLGGVPAPTDAPTEPTETQGSTVEQTVEYTAL